MIDLKDGETIKPLPCGHGRINAIPSFRVPGRIGYRLECAEACGVEDQWIDHDWRKHGHAVFETQKEGVK